MPFARISLLKGKSPAYVRAISDGVHQALVDAFEAPADDRFQAIHQHDPNELIFDKNYLGGPRSDGYVLICITAGRLRSTSVKQGFYKQLVKLLAESPGVRPEDVMVIINTTQADEWSFSSGKSVVKED